MRPYSGNSRLFRIVAPIVYGVIIYTLILLISNDVRKLNTLFVSEEVYVCIGLTYITFESIRLMVILMNRLVTSDRQNLAILVGFTIVSTLVSVTLVLFALSTYFRLVIGFSASATQLWIFGSVYALTAFLYDLLYCSDLYLKKENTVKLKLEQQNRDVLEMEMNAFRNELNPDLLYESLEDLIGIMQRDTGEAEAYIDTLASAYRNVLQYRRTELAPLHDEVKSAMVIVRLLNERLNGQLKLETDLSSAAGREMLIPGTLAGIVESVARRSIIRPSTPFVIRCYLEEGSVILRCPLNEKLVTQPAAEAAIDRLKRSYSMYSPQPMERRKSAEEIYFRIPVLKVTEEVDNP